MAKRGSRSRQVMLFMDRQDEDVLSGCLAEALKDRAIWMAEAPYGTKSSRHRTLREALDASDPPGQQALLRLLGDHREPVGPAVQYLASWLEVHEGVPMLRSGRLAYKWTPGGESEAIGSSFEVLAGAAWSCMISCTKPHVGLLDGTPVRSARIGAHAKAWFVADQSHRLTDRGSRHIVYGVVR